MNPEVKLNLKGNIKMEKNGVEKNMIIKNIFVMNSKMEKDFLNNIIKIFSLKENITTVKEIVKEKNIIISVIRYYLKENIWMIEDGMEKDMI